MKKVTVEFTEEQLKMLLIVTGNMSGSMSCRGVFPKLLNVLNIDVYSVPDPQIKGSGIFVTDEMIESLKN